MKRTLSLIVLVLCGPATATVLSIPVTAENIGDLTIPLEVSVAQEPAKEGHYLRYTVSTTLDPDVAWEGELYIPGSVRAALRPEIESDTISWSVSLGPKEVDDAVLGVAAADPDPSHFGYTLAFRKAS